MKGPRYIRKGKCNRCGDCCKNEECENLRWEGNTACCSRHNSMEGGAQQEKCVVFPEAPPIVFSRCGYFFVDTWEDNRIIRPGEV